jgi:hypothetical protein
MRARLLAVLIAVAPAPAAAQAVCPHGPADAERTISVPVDRSATALEAEADSVMTALGYARAAAASAEAFYVAQPRSGWPRGAEVAPWHTADAAPPGWLLKLRFEPDGLRSTIWVSVQPLCAIESTKKSRRESGPEHMLAIFGGMQVVTALSGALETALHPYP